MTDIKCVNDPDVQFRPISDDSYIIQPEKETMTCVSISPTFRVRTIECCRDVISILSNIECSEDDILVDNLRIKQISITSELDEKFDFDVIYDVCQQNTKKYTAITLNDFPIAYGNCLITGRNMTGLPYEQCRMILNSARLKRVSYKILDIEYTNKISVCIELKDGMPFG